MKQRLSVVTLVLILAILACNTPQTPMPSQTSAPPPATTHPGQGTPTRATVAPPSATARLGQPTSPPAVKVTAPPNVRGQGFASYKKITVSLPAKYQGYSLPVDPGAASNYREFKFSAGQAKLLTQNGFVMTPAEWREFFQVYEDARYKEMPVFVTTDSVYHIYHLIFDKMLRDLERDRLAPDIAALTRACMGTAKDLYAKLKGTEMEKHALRVWAYFSVADNLISPGSAIPPEVADMVKQELALIQAHSGLSGSPIFSQDCPQGCNPCDPNPPPQCLDKPCLCEDYSQYVPRGHYTRSEQLQRYFRVMMWYGRINLRLQKPDETRMALLITYILRNTKVNGKPATEVWSRVYDPTVFIVGKADDLGIYEYSALADSVYGAGAPPAAIADAAKLNTFIQAARQLPPPQVNSMWVYIWEDKAQVTQGFRFMGQRFTLDAYVFQQLIWRNVGIPGKERWLPQGLDVMAALGSKEAYSILEQSGETAYKNYPERMKKVRGEISGLQTDSWTQNLYWNWLYALQPLLESKGPQYPSFMQTQAWARKDLHTALGSWTELKHDTILYAKQVMAEMGGGGEEPEPPRGWVEPNPEAYARLLTLTRMTTDGLKSRGLLTDNTQANLTRLDDLLTFLLDVSQQELAGKPLSQGAYERIKYYGGELEAMTLAAADPQGEGRPFFSEDDQAALVADVATDPNGQVLEEATGRILDIYAIVPNGKGGLNIAKGGVFSYYEFPWPINDRLTDESWRAMLNAGEAPPQPEWTGSFIAR
jgi:Protein of unknown function (DUF3160)